VIYITVKSHRFWMNFMTAGAFYLFMNLFPAIMTKMAESTAHHEEILEVICGYQVCDVFESSFD